MAESAEDAAKKVLDNFDYNIFQATSSVHAEPAVDVHTCICVYIYIYIHRHIYAHVYVYPHIYIYIHMIHIMYEMNCLGLSNSQLLRGRDSSSRDVICMFRFLQEGYTDNNTTNNNVMLM